MSKRIVHQATAFSLAAIFTFSILGSINMLAVQPGEHSVMAAERAASQVAQSVPASSHKQVGS
ncbi:MAG TPA: hypothetical protein VK570_03760 [Rubrivivax sp.]|jgi:hypothetical protein|nr:hypothetical protein [Rubrivivax sp.]